ncbi:TPA: helix-turn-helix transcriptional regulator [Serratia marcescens]
MNPIKIVIDDGNHYFSVGLQLSIIEYAEENNKKVTFLTQNEDERPDVIFASSLCRAGRWYNNSRRWVTIQERKFPAVYDSDWGLNRCASQAELFVLLEKVFAYTLHISLCAPNPLTQREKQVIKYLRRGLDQSQTARVLGVSVKTVHSHKRSVMSKMMLRRPHDFMYWLISYEGEYS